MNEGRGFKHFMKLTESHSSRRSLHEKDRNKFQSFRERNVLLDQKSRSLLPELAGCFPSTTRNNVNRYGLEYLNFKGPELKEYHGSKVR